MAVCLICKKVEVKVKPGVEFGDLCPECKYRCVMLLGRLYVETEGGKNEIATGGTDKIYKFTQKGKDAAKGELSGN